jgi:DUF1707 SHOCT-like domain
VITQPGDGTDASRYARARVSDAGRERAIDVLKAAIAEGRLTRDEHAERVGRAYGSRTYAELAAVSGDPPAGPLGALPSPGPGVTSRGPFPARPRGPIRWPSPPWPAGSSRYCRPRSPRSPWALRPATRSGRQASEAPGSPGGTEHLADRCPGIRGGRLIAGWDREFSPQTLPRRAGADQVPVPALLVNPADRRPVPGPAAARQPIAVAGELPAGLKLIYTAPARQYPLSGRPPVPRRRALTSWARANGALIAEDDCDGGSRYDVAALPALFGLDPRWSSTWEAPPRHSPRASSGDRGRIGGSGSLDSGQLPTDRQPIVGRALYISTEPHHIR